MKMKSNELDLAYVLNNGENLENLEENWQDDLVLKPMEGSGGPTPFTGLAYELGEDGKTVLYYGTYEDGLPHGISVFIHPNGQIKNKATIFHGTGHGWSRQWNQQGRLVFLGEYIRGISVRFREWDEAGNLKDEKTGPSETERAIIEQRMLAAKKNWPDEADGLSYDFLESKGWPAK